MPDDQVLREVLRSPLDDMPPPRPVGRIVTVSAVAVLVLVGGVALLSRSSDEVSSGSDATSAETGSTVSADGDGAAPATTALPAESVFPDVGVFREMAALGDGSLLAFGGLIPLPDATAPIEGTWRFDVSQGDWERFEVDPEPSPRFGHALAFHPPTGLVVLFGGGTTQPRPCPQTRFCTGPEDNQVWHFDPGTGTWEDKTPAVPDDETWPAVRFGTRFAYEPITDRLVMFGGVGVFGERFTPTFYEETWFYDPATNTWENVTDGSAPVPTGRTTYGLAWHDETQRVLMFGGDSRAGTDDARLWAFDPATNAWEDLGESETGPFARWFHLTTVDPQTGQFVMAGGVGDIFTPIQGGTLRDVGPLDEVWLWSEADGWVSGAIAPVVLDRPAGDGDPATQTVVVEIGGDVLGYDAAVGEWVTLSERPEEDE